MALITAKKTACAAGATQGPSSSADYRVSARPAHRCFVLLEQRCHNINLVTPSHVVPQILEALSIGVARGLRLPLVYNTSAYDSLDALKLMDGIIDIYMPDLKYWDSDFAKRYSNAPDYPDVARAAIKEMNRQVGLLLLDEEGVALRGVLLRHLVMPAARAGSQEIFAWIARELGPDTDVNIMSQYHPAGWVVQGRDFSEINRRVTSAEFRQAVRDAADAGLTRFQARSTRWQNTADPC